MWGGGGGGGILSPTISLRLGGWESGKFMSVFVNFLVLCCLRKVKKHLILQLAFIAEIKSTKPTTNITNYSSEFHSENKLIWISFESYFGRRMVKTSQKIVRF